jgi:hypothetical protein
MELASWDDDRVKFMRIEMNSMSSDRAGKVIEQIKDEIASVKGNPDFDTRANQTQTLSHLKKMG